MILYFYNNSKNKYKTRYYIKQTFTIIYMYKFI